MAKQVINSRQHSPVRARQGGTTGAGSWQTTGTSTTDLSNTATFIQVGSAVTSGGAVVVTMPVAYSQLPLVFASVNSATSNNVFVRVTGQSTTQFTLTVITDAGSLGSAENISWMTIGQ